MVLTVAEPCDNPGWFCEVDFGHGFWTPLAALGAGEQWLSQNQSVVSATGPRRPQLAQIRSWLIETGTWRLIETRTRDHRGTDAVLGFFGKTMELTAGTFGGGGA